MAEAGFTAPPDILDDPRFYDPLHIDGTGPLKILKLYFKEHASCRWTHPAIEGALECLTKLGGSPNQVEEVVIQTFAVARLLDNTRPQSAVQAQFSIPYTVAAAIVFGEMGAAQQDQTCFEDALVQKIADAVQIELDPAHDSVFPDQTEATVTVRLNDGSSASTTIEFPRGDPQRPLEPEVLKRRARGLLDPVLGPTQTSALMDTVNQLEHCDATDVTSLLQVSA
jgi:2-methylcitrate dehydratase PrpD